MDRKSAVTSRLTVEEAQFITDGLVALPQHPADIINPDEQEVDEVKKDQLLADSNNTQGGVASPAYKIYIRDMPPGRAVFRSEMPNHGCLSGK